MKLEWPERLIEAGTLFLLVFTPLAFGTVDPWSEAVAELVVLGMAVIYVLGTLRHWELRVEVPPGWLPGLLFLLLVVFQAVAPGWSVDAHETGRQLLKLLAAAGFFLICWNTYRIPAQARRALWTMIGMGGLLALFGIMQRMTWNGHLYWIGPAAPISAFGPFVNRAHFAGLILTVLPLALAAVLTSRRSEVGRHRVRLTWRDRLRQWNSHDEGPAGLIILLVLVMGGAVLVSGSRGGLVALLGVLGAMVLACLVGERSGVRRAAHAVAAIVLIILAGTWMSSEIFHGTIERLVEELGRPSDSSRLRIWTDALALWQSAPVTGTGLATFGSAFPRLRTMEAPFTFAHAESDWVQLFTDTGALGVGLAVVTLISFGLTLYRTSHALASPRGLFRLCGLLALVGTVLHSIGNFNMPVMSSLVYLALAVALGGRWPNGHVSVPKVQRSKVTSMRGES